MSKQDDLKKLKDEISQIELPIKSGATQLVFGVGDPNASILYLGEAPGFWEDQKGEPFVGNAGKLLDKSLASIGLERKEVFITNVVMYRPPDNRDPLPEELEAFDRYINRLIEIINPRIIVTLGRFSMAKFLPGVKITQVHGKLYQRQFNKRRIYIMPMFHPAAALRSPAVLEMFKGDFLRIPKALEKIETLRR